MTLPTPVIGLVACFLVVALPYVVALLAPPVATPAKFEALRPGMTRAAIEGLLGEPGLVEKREIVEGHEKVHEAWINPDGSALTVELVDGRMVAKSAERLK